MEFAFDPKHDDNVTVEMYRDRYGPKSDSLGNARFRPILKCLVCNVPLHTVAETIPTAVATWGHDPSPGVFCPVKAEGAHRYEMLPPSNGSPTTGAALRQRFFNNWQAHWGHIRTLVPYPEIQTLIGFLKAADKSSFWDYRNLDEWHIPYVFLATCDFPPPTGKASTFRKEWLRFRFDARYKTLADLWIKANPDFSFLRLIYKNPPRKSEPGQTEFIAAERITPDFNWHLKSFPIAHEFALNRMCEAFPRDLHLNALSMHLQKRS